MMSEHSMEDVRAGSQRRVQPIPSVALVLTAQHDGSNLELGARKRPFSFAFAINYTLPYLHIRRHS